MTSDRRQGADGGPAAPSGCSEECALRLDSLAGRPIVDGRRCRHHPLVAGPDLDGDGALARGRRQDLGVKTLGDPMTKAEAVEARAGKDERVGLTLIEPSEPGVDVAVERMNDQVRPSGEQEAGPARTVRPDTRARRQIGETALRGIGPDDQRVARVGAGKVRGDT